MPPISNSVVGRSLRARREDSASRDILRQRPEPSAGLAVTPLLVPTCAHELCKADWCDRGFPPRRFVSNRACTGLEVPPWHPSDSGRNSRDCACLYLAWAALQDGNNDPGSADLAGLADQLAIAVETQWDSEARVRRLNDPYPLPVSWMADPDLTGDWALLERLARSGAGWPDPPAPGTWTGSAAELAGHDGDLVRVLVQVPTGRLVVLGEPGAGKTMLMIRLVLDLLARRSHGDPVPVLVPIASWNPDASDLHTWLATQLAVAYPALAAPGPAIAGGGNRIQALLRAGLILPLLDGLDEIPVAIRGSAVSRINDSLKAGERIVVTCRTEDYRKTVAARSLDEIRLRSAAVIEIEELDVSAVSRYLCDDAAGPAAKGRWLPVLAALGAKNPLKTPLMASLARVIYNPRPGETLGGLRDPAELLNSEFADRRAVESMLFDGLIPAAYRGCSRWKARQSERWLLYLAFRLEGLMSKAEMPWAFGLWGLFAYRPGTQILRLNSQMSPLRWRVLAGLTVALGGLVILTTAVNRYPSASSGNIILAIFGFVFVFVFFLAALSSPQDLTRVSNTREALSRDRALTLIVIVAVLAVFWPVFMLRGKGGINMVGLLIGCPIGVVAGLAASVMIGTAWPGYLSARSRLALLGRLPWQFLAFLEDAHRRGVLRQEGAIYQFRHIELQHRLAKRYLEEHLRAAKRVIRQESP